MQTETISLSAFIARMQKIEVIVNNMELPDGVVIERFFALPNSFHDYQVIAWDKETHLGMGIKGADLSGYENHGDYNVIDSEHTLLKVQLLYVNGLFGIELSIINWIKGTYQETLHMSLCKAYSLADDMEAMYTALVTLDVLNILWEPLQVNELDSYQKKL